MTELCGCCAGIEVAIPVSEVNPPGRSALSYRVGTFATFFETMLARLGELPALTTRERSDPSIALLDAWAVVGDVLTFYQERIANEGYLQTARERRSTLELARLIGYRVRPGVASSVSLAFTVAAGFAGSIPAGTRAQSIPGAGESPQFFETSAAFDARDAWNGLTPRRSRPQRITAPGATFHGIPVVTGADVIDTVYCDGVATNLKAADLLFFIFGSAPGEQSAREVQTVDVQASDNRTEVTLVPPALDLDLRRTLTLLSEKTRYLFAGSDIAARTEQILEALLQDLDAGATGTVAAGLLRAAIPQIALQQAIADRRHFTRVSGLLDRMQSALRAALASTALRAAPGRAVRNLHLTPFPAAPGSSPLANLDAIVERLALRPSVQPPNPLRLDRSVARSFSPQSDIAPRLIAALKPAAASSLYSAWTGLARPSARVRVFAPRVKATLFAGSYPGPATVTQSTAAGSVTIQTSFPSPPALNTAWTGSLPWIGRSAPPAVALDALYDRIAAGSWIAIDRPALDDTDPLKRARTFHLVTATRTTNMDTGTGFSAKVTVLTVEPLWLSDLTGDPLFKAVQSTTVLRDTVVYAQSEPLPLSPEPLDTDIEGASVDLDGVYDGLEPGRWIVVSGTRTDVPNASGVVGSERAMIAAVAQGAQAPLCIASPLTAPPFATVFYTTDADVHGDRLVVGQLRTEFTVANLPSAEMPDQQYCDQVLLGPGIYGNAYVPTDAERKGAFPSFDGLLVDPQTYVPYPGGTIPSAALESGVFAWRISTEPLHTTITLAGRLAYSYDRAGATIYGNVVDATHGQSIGEVLGDGDAARVFPTFGVRQSPLTYVSAPTPSGTASTLTVRVNDLAWHESRDLAGAAPNQRCYVTVEDDAQKTSLTFGDGEHGARLPSGTANVKATYRYGIGKAGNVAAGRISQLATHPLGLQAVLNPLPATGGADADRVDQVRANAPLAVTALDRLVSVSDYADFARTYAGIGKAASVRLSDGRQQLVHLTIAGADDIAIDAASDLYRNLRLSLQTYGDPSLPVEIGIRRVKLLVMSARVRLSPDYVWDAVVPKIRTAVLAAFAFDARQLGQTAFLSEAVRTVQDVAGVDYVDVTVFDGVGEATDAAGLASLGATLTKVEYVTADAARIDATAPRGSARRILPAELVFMTPDIPETLILTEVVAR